MAINKTMVFAGICTLLQAGVQMILTTLGITQHFCVIDFLKEFPLLIYIRILYFHNPGPCGTRINIGQAIDSIADQAFVLLTQEPLTAFRTFIINSIGLGLSILWVITSVILMTFPHDTNQHSLRSFYTLFHPGIPLVSILELVYPNGDHSKPIFKNHVFSYCIVGGAKDNHTKHVRWPWIIVTVCQCGVDLVATVTYANDSFHTRTLSDIMDFVGGTASGMGNVQLLTAWASWTMVLLYSRFVVLFVVNVLLVIVMVVECNVARNTKESIAVQVEAPPLPPAPVPAPVAAPPIPLSRVSEGEISDQVELEGSSTPSAYREAARIPRAGLSRSFRRMKEFLFRRSPEPRSRSHPDSLDVSAERLSRPQKVEMLVEVAKKRTVQFPENVLSLPQRLENMIAEQRRRLDHATVDTSGRVSPPRTTQSLPQLDSTNLTDARGRRGTTAELQGQLPWAYIPASAHRMRDQLPDDEDLPPVPLPDYTAIPSFRKASVHRAASSLSSSTQKKDYGLQSTRPPLTQSDVLY